MIEVNAEPIGATIHGVFYKLPPRLATALERLVKSKSPIFELVSGRDSTSQKVCAHDLRRAIRGSGYTIVNVSDGYLLVSEQLERIKNANP